MKKKFINIILTVALAVTCFFGITIYTSAKEKSNRFTIENNPTSIEAGIEAHLNNESSDTTFDIKIKKIEEIDNKTFVLFTSDNKLCFGELSKDENGMLGIDYVSSEDAIIKANISTIGDTKYIVAFGSNPKLKINELSISTDSIVITLPVPSEDYFITYDKIPTDSDLQSSATINLYDKKGRDVTFDIYNKTF